jgi:hypothetical protein
MINASSEMQDEAWEFVEWMTAPEQLVANAVAGSKLPVRKSLYNDPEVLNKVPVARLSKQAIIDNATPRPVSPYYSDVSLELAEQLNTSLGATFPPKKPSQPCKRISNRSSTKANKPLGEAARCATRFSTPLRSFQQVSTSAFQVGRGSRRSNLEESFQTDIDSSASAHQQRVEKKKLKC